MASYYEILEIDKTATPDQIREAFRKLARFYHPDNTDAKLDPDTAAKFQKIQEAYNTLIDPERRRQYDLQTNKSTALAKSAGANIVKGGKGLVDFIDKVTSYEPLGRVVNKSAANLGPDWQGMKNFWGTGQQPASEPKQSKPKQKPAKAKKSPMAVLKERYANGEISEQQYLKMKRQLEE